MTRQATIHHGGFSLIEVLLGIFILGIGVISIAAIFPAGIVQQRQSVDDIIGPTVANNAIAVIRSKVQSADFGYLLPANSYTTNGDWGWARPAFVLVGGTPVGTDIIPQGSIVLFNDGTVANTSACETTWSGLFTTVPLRVITQRERYFPQGTVLANTNDVPRPQYVWDCMFRRFEGRMQVAIFVYRVTTPGQAASVYAVPPQPPGAPDPTVPRLPISLDLTDPATLAFNAGGAWDDGGIDADVNTFADNAFVLGTQSGTAYDETDERQAWQEPGQWLLDQNGNIHRVLGHIAQDQSGSGNEEVELVRAVPPMPFTAVNFFPTTVGTSGDYAVVDVVSNIWYLPAEMDTNGDGIPDVRITPVYVTVKDL